MKRLEIYFLDLRQAAGRPIGWVIAEELGDFGLRFHVHALVSGVEELLIPTWQKTAFRRFGISEIKRFHLGIGAGHYIAKHALDESGGLHFGGTLARDARMPNYPEVGRNV